HRLDAPLPAPDREPLRCLPGRLHAGNHAVAQDGPVPRSAIVVFAGRDVAGTAREVNLQDAGVFLLSLLPSQAAEVAANTALAVMAHGVRRIVTEGGQGSVRVPEAQGLEPWINQAFGRGAGLLILGAATPPVLHLAVGAEHPTVGCDVMDSSLPYADVSERRRAAERSPDRIGRLLHDTVEEMQIQHPGCVRSSFQ